MRETDRQTDRQTDGRTDGRVDRQTNRDRTRIGKLEIGKKRQKKAFKYKDYCFDRQTGRQRQRKTETDRERRTLSNKGTAVLHNPLLTT